MVVIYITLLLMVFHKNSYFSKIMRKSMTKLRSQTRSKK